MARDDLDELFGEGEGAPEPRTTTAIALAIGGVVVALIGMVCLAAPGGVMVLLALWWIERELDRVDNGYLPESARPAVNRARNVVFSCLALVIGLFFIQAFLYCSGFYQNIGDTFFLGILPGLS